MRLIMTGTGTPHPCLQRAGPGQVVEVAGELLLFDCGEGTLRQLMCAGVPAQDVNTLFLTHLHLDHTAGLTGFIFGSWYLARRGAFTNKRLRLQVYGPAGAGPTLDSLKEAYRKDLADRSNIGPADAGVLRLLRAPAAARPRPRAAGVSRQRRYGRSRRHGVVRLPHRLRRRLAGAVTPHTPRASSSWPAAPTYWCTRRTWSISARAIPSTPPSGTASPPSIQPRTGWPHGA